MAKLASFDTKTRANSGVEFELSDLRTGEGSGVFFTVHGTDTDALRAYQSRREIEFKERAASGVKNEAPMDEQAAEFLADMTIGWRGLEDDAGDIPFSKERAAEIYLQHPALKEQVDLFIARRENFLRG